jgi:hypothetical protein
MILIDQNDYLTCVHLPFRSRPLADRTSVTVSASNSRMTNFGMIILVLNCVVVATTIGSVLLLTRKVRILVPKMLQSIKTSANVNRNSSIPRHN